MPNLARRFSFDQYRCVVLHQEQKIDHFRTVAIDVHRMFHHDSTALATRP